MKPEHQANATVKIEKDILIHGTFSNEEILHFFSFLFCENSEIDGSFLSKEAFDHIFKHGLKIPSVLPLKKYKLHSTKRFPKKIVDFFIHSFIVRYNYNKKRDILNFFGSYIYDYEKALDTLGYQGVSKNITGEPPKNMKHSLATYLPERFS